MLLSKTKPARALALLLGTSVLAACQSGAGLPQAATPTSGQAITQTSCAFGKITVFNGPSGGTGGVNIASGLGSLWYGDIGLNDMVRLSTKGLTKVKTIPASNADPEGVALGPNNAMWFTEWTQPDIGSITTKLRIRLWAVKGLGGQQSGAVAMVQGPDKRIWFTTASHGLGAKKVSKGTTLYTTGIDGEDPSGIGVGPDKNLWFVTFSGPDIGKMTTSGKVTTYNVGAYGGFGIIAGPDGHVWFADPGNSRIGTVKTDGSGLTYYNKNLIGQPFNLVAASDGNMYFTTGPTGTVGQITTKGVIHECKMNAGQTVVGLGITIGPDKNVWILDNQHSQIARLIIK
jgi:virginiamycin B lyase